MASSVNKVILIGNLGKAPEIRHGNDGTKNATFSIATGETWKDKNTGERKERTEWHRIVVFNEKLAEIVERYVQKGSRVYVEGQLQTRKWTDQQGVERYTTEIVLSRFRGEITLLDSKPAGAGDSSYGDSFGSSTFDTSPLGSSSNFDSSFSGGSSSSTTQRFDELNDDVPF